MDQLERSGVDIKNGIGGLVSAELANKIEKF